MASIKQRKSKFSVIYWYMDDTGERKQKWDTLETKKEAKARKAFIEFYQQTYGYVFFSDVVIPCVFSLPSNIRLRLVSMMVTVKYTSLTS